MFALNINGNAEEYLTYVTTQLAPTVISLCVMVKDDYKLKTLNANVLIALFRSCKSSVCPTIW